MIGRRRQALEARKALEALEARKALEALKAQVRDLQLEVRQLTNRLDRQGAPKGTPDEAFRETARAARSARRTLLGLDRLHILWQAVRNSAPLDLPALEVGSYRGGSAWFLAEAHRRIAGPELELHVVDTFAGHVAGEIGEGDDAAAHTPGHFADTSAREVRAYLAPFPRVQVHEGAFADVAGELPDGPLGLAHVDVDLLEPTRDILAYLTDRLAPGGVAVVDDYGAPKCPGIAIAAAELLERDGDRFEVWDFQTQQLVLVRRSEDR